MTTPSPTPPPLTTEQLQEQVRVLQETVVSLKRVLQQQQTSQSSNPTLPASSTTAIAHSPSGLKVAPPDVYDGTSSKADSFISQLYLYFYGKKVQVSSDRIVLALSYMKGGTAGPWAKQKVKWLADQDTDSVDWDSFIQEFKQTFGDPNPAGTARYKLSQLKQGSHTAEEYVSSFREFMDDTGYNDVALVESFKRGLNQSLVDRIYCLPEMPTTLETWIAWATKLDRQEREREVEKKTYNFFSKFPSSKPQPKPSPSAPAPLPTTTIQHQSPAPAKQPDVVPMEVDSGWRSVRPLICFKCRKPGHKAINCRSSVNINNMDHDSLKAYFKEEMLKEQAQEKDQASQKDF